ncbi:hypothetical protein [Saccharopolyspora phatthalungensis]|uniref:Uncharacterized protein n=1 Tax=Saccharopolyspora phatthalungensis TaxID=664693 RepID=A0A840Q9X9_9PSEU|nr:hypothetical protein [Saccharopolyspora phatthalungensis]
MPALGVFAQFKQIVLVAYDRIVGLLLEDISVDGCITKAIGEIASSPRNRPQWSLLLLQFDLMRFGIIRKLTGGDFGQRVNPGTQMECQLRSASAWTLSLSE